MNQRRSDIIAWVANFIVPHEAALRQRLRRLSIDDQEIGDVVQDAYLAISRLDGVGHIRNPRAYLFQTARTIVLQRVRRDRIVRIDQMTDMEALTLADDEPDPEQHVSGRQDLARVRRLIAGLPDRCREIFELRRVQGVSQRQIAARLSIPEHTVEAQSARGLRLILAAIAEEDGRHDG